MGQPGAGATAEQWEAYRARNRADQALWRRRHPERHRAAQARRYRRHRDWLASVAEEPGLGIYDASIALGYSHYHLSDLARRGVIRARKEKGAWRIPVMELDRLRFADSPSACSALCAAPDCGRSFRRTTANHRFCSRPCQNRAWYKNTAAPRDRVCVNDRCLRPFRATRSDQRYCSASCQRATWLRAYRRRAA